MNKIYIEDVNPCGSERNYLKENTELYDTHFPMEAVIYTRRTPSESPVYLNYADGVDIVQDRRTLGYLDAATASLLKKLNYSFKFNFSVEIDKVVQKNENYNIHIKINKNNTFETLAFKKGDVFKEIKTFLIGDMPYNKIQKKALSSIYKNERNTILVTDPGRGSGTIIKNIALFNKFIDKKTLIVTEEKMPSVYREYCDIEGSYIEGYHSYIFINSVPQVEIPDGRSLVISKRELDLKNYDTIVDHFHIPDNITILSEDELLKGWDSHLTYYSKKLPLDEKMDFARNYQKYHKILATRDVTVFL